MTEAEARAWIGSHFGVEAVERLERFESMLIAESVQQNLIARSTLPAIWSRHFADSAQLALLAGAAGEGAWVDIGSGAGLPGVVAAIVQARPVVLIEPRRRRADFLDTVVAALDLDAEVIAARAETVARAPAAIVTARAVAPLGDLFAAGVGFSDLSTLWLFPKGRSGQAELEAARPLWHGMFHVEPSRTASDSAIVIAKKVRRR